MRIIVQRQEDPPPPSVQANANGNEAAAGERRRAAAAAAAALHRGHNDDQAMYSSDEDYGMESEQDEYENENENEGSDRRQETAPSVRALGLGDVGARTSNEEIALSAVTLSKPGTTVVAGGQSERVRSDSPVDHPPSPSGYNSADEHQQLPKVPEKSARSPISVEVSDLESRVMDEMAREKEFEENLKREKRFTIRRIKEDGNCLFRAISDQMYGDEEAHSEMRQMCFDYMVAERGHFSQFVTEDFDAYIERKRKDKCYGNHLEIQAMSEMFNRPIEVYNYSMEPINVHQDFYKTDMPPMRISYHRGNHYNSIVDPTAPSVGVGLGLPAYEAGRSAENELVEEVKKASEQEELDAYVLEESRRLADLEQIEQTERVLEESLIESSWRDHIRSMQSAGRGGSSSGPGASSSRSPPSSSKKPQSTFAQDLYDNADVEMQSSEGNPLTSSVMFLPPAVQKLTAMGFSENQLAEAFSIFGSDLDNILCYLTAESSDWAMSYKEKYFAAQRANRNREKNSLKRPAEQGPM